MTKLLDPSEIVLQPTLETQLEAIKLYYKNIKEIPCIRNNCNGTMVNLSYQSNQGLVIMYKCKKCKYVWMKKFRIYLE